MCVSLLVEQLRFSAFAVNFPFDYRSAAVGTWWSEIVGDEPEQEGKSTVNAQSVAEGPFRSGRLAVVVTPGRVDWLFSAANPLGSETATWPAIGPWPDAVGEVLMPIHHKCY
jgi:hypothetical protein